MQGSPRRLLQRWALFIALCCTGLFINPALAATPTPTAPKAGTASAPSSQRQIYLFSEGTHSGIGERYLWALCDVMNDLQDPTKEDFAKVLMEDVSLVAVFRSKPEIGSVAHGISDQFQRMAEGRAETTKAALVEKQADALTTLAGAMLRGQHSCLTAGKQTILAGPGTGGAPGKKGTEAASQPTSAELPRDANLEFLIIEPLGASKIETIAARRVLVEPAPTTNASSVCPSGTTPFEKRCARFEPMLYIGADGPPDRVARRLFVEFFWPPTATPGHGPSPIEASTGPARLALDMKSETRCAPNACARPGHSFTTRLDVGHRTLLVRPEDVEVVEWQIPLCIHEIAGSKEARSSVLWPEAYRLDRDLGRSAKWVISGPAQCMITARVRALGSKKTEGEISTIVDARFLGRLLWSSGELARSWHLELRDMSGEDRAERLLVRELQGLKIVPGREIEALWFWLVDELSKGPYDEESLSNLSPESVRDRTSDLRVLRDAALNVMLKSKDVFLDRIEAAERFTLSLNSVFQRLGRKKRPLPQLCADIVTEVEKKATIAWIERWSEGCRRAVEKSLLALKQSATPVSEFAVRRPGAGREPRLVLAEVRETPEATIDSNKLSISNDLSTHDASSQPERYQLSGRQSDSFTAPLALTITFGDPEASGHLNFEIGTAWQRDQPQTFTLRMAFGLPFVDDLARWSFFYGGSMAQVSSGTLHGGLQLGTSLDLDLLWPICRAAGGGLPRGSPHGSPTCRRFYVQTGLEVLWNVVAGDAARLPWLSAFTRIGYRSGAALGRETIFPTLFVTGGVGLAPYADTFFLALGFGI
jgi:hypothetical protein